MPVFRRFHFLVEINRTLRAVELASAKLIKDGKLKRVDPRKGGC
jgi:hypothetical protein